MADDKLGAQGFAQILKGPNIGNMYALAQMKQRQQAQEADLAAKRAKAEMDDFDAQIKLKDNPNLNLKLNQVNQETTQLAKNVFSQVYNQGVRNGQFTPESRQMVSQAKDAVERSQELTQGYHATNQAILADIDKQKEIMRLDKAKDRLKSLDDEFATKDQNGNWNLDTRVIAKQQDFFKDPTLYDPLKLMKQYSNSIGTVANDIFRSGDVSDQLKFKNVFKTDKNGEPILDKQTGKPLVDTTPEAIALFDAGGEMNSKVLDQYATEKGIPRNQAFGELMSKVADYSSVKSKHYDSPDGAGTKIPTKTQVSDAVTTITSPVYSKIPVTGDIKGVYGVTGKTLPLQNTYNDLKGKMFSFGDQTGEVIGIVPDPETGKLSVNLRKPKANNEYEQVTVPYSKAVRESLVGAIKNKEDKKDLTDNLDLIEREGISTLKVDDTKLEGVVNDIKKTLSDVKDDDEAAIQLKNYLQGKGLEVKEVKVDHSSLPFTNDTVKIDGKTFDLNESGIKKLKDHLFSINDKPFRKEAGASTPKAGDEMDGYKFKGGDPSDQSNWEKL